MIEWKRLLALCCLGSAALGCSKETTSSANIKTGGIAALMDVYADSDDTAKVHVELRVGGSSSNTYVALEGGDKLTATAGTVTKDLTSTDTGIYEGTFSDVGADTPFSVILVRPDDTTAEHNSGELPAPFDLVRPKANLSRETDALDVTWRPSDTGDPMSLEIDGDCIFAFSAKPSDTGTFSVKPGVLSSTGGDMPETCDLTAELQRSRTGSADPSFDPESWFRLHQRRSASFTSKP